MKLECKMLNLECDNVTEEAKPEDFIFNLYRHLEDKHEDFLFEWFRTKPHAELLRLIDQRTEKS